jgi:hypothetical protein
MLRSRPARRYFGASTHVAGLAGASPPTVSTGRAVKAAVRRYYLRTGTDAHTAERLAARFSGHSGRVGLIVASKDVGAADSDIAATTRHKSLQMIKRYGEAAEQRLRAPRRLRGVGL